MSRLTCSHWIWANDNAAGAQCGARVVIGVGETLGFCQLHSKSVMSLPKEKQKMLGVRHLA